MSLVNVNVPNLLNGVSQQADPLRFATQGGEQINGMSSIVSGLTKRNGAEFVCQLSRNSLRNRNPYVHFINRDNDEKYVVLFYGGLTEPTADIRDYGFLRVWDLKTGNEKKVYKRYEDDGLISSNTPILTYGTNAGAPEAFGGTDQEQVGFYGGASFYLGQNPKKNLKVFTVADSTFVLNTSRTVRTTPATRPASLTNKTVNRSGTTATVNLGAGVLNTDVEIGEVIQVLGTTALAGSVIVTGKPTGTSFTFDTVDAGPVTYINNVSFEKGERLVPFDMPHTLIRQADGSFLLERNYWNARGVGTGSSNPNPSFVGKTLNDIFMYRSRLGFLSDENVILSENSQFYSFYRTELSTLLDSDPIDVSTSHSKVTILHNAIPFSERLVLFSDEAQFYMTAADILTPKTASIQQTTEFSVDKTAKPVVVGKNIFFPFNRGNFSGVMEYFITQDTLEFNGLDVTSPIPAYIRDRITKIVSSNNEQIVALITEDSQNTIYIYKYFTTEDQKLQSSWSKWELGSVDEKILGMEFIDNYLYLVVDKTSNETLNINANPSIVFQKQSTNLLRINVQDFYSDATSDFFVKLDKKIDESQLLNSSYDSATDITTFTFPYLESGTSIVVAERAESDRVSYVFDASPENDSVIIPSGWDSFNTNYTLLPRGTSVNLPPLFSGQPFTGSHISLTGLGSRNAYSSGTSYAAAQVNGIVCYIATFLSKVGTNPLEQTSVHWIVCQRRNSSITQFYISKPYPDFRSSLWNETTDPLFEQSSTSLPQSLPMYPWDVTEWYSRIDNNTLADIPNINLVTGEAYLADSINKQFHPRRTPQTTISLPDTTIGKLFPVETVSSVAINNPYWNKNFDYTQIQVKGNQLNKPLWFGVPYEFRYQFSNPYLRLGGGGGQKTSVSDGRFQVKNGNLTFNDTVAFNVEVTSPFRNKNIYKFSNYTLGRGDSIIDTLPIKNGTFRFPVLSRNDKELKVEIVNNTPFPSSFISIDWEAFYSARARRI
jgi:hypothetical protein